MKGGLQMFCAVLAWSRYRFVGFARDQRRETTLTLLAECFEEWAGYFPRLLGRARAESYPEEFDSK